MKKTISVISFSLLYGLAYPQQGNKPDTLTGLYLEGEYAAIKTIIRESIRKNEGTKDLWYLYGKAHESLFDFDSAGICYEHALSFDSADIKVLNSLANINVNKRNFNKATTFYWKILTINPMQKDAKANLANLLLRTDKDRQAKELFGQLVNDDTTNYYFMSQLATCYHNMNITDSAVYFYEKSLQLNPEDYLSVIRLSNIYIRHGAMTDGLDITEKYLQQDSSNVQVLKLNAYIHFLSGHYDKAIAQYLRSSAYGDSSFNVVKYLGLSYYQKEDMYMAAIYLDKAYRLDSTDMETCLYLGISTGWTMDKLKGIGYLKKTLDMIFPADELVVRIYRELADLYMAWSKPEDAVPYYLKILDYDTDNRLVLYKLGRCYEYIDKEKALDWYTEFMKTRDPDAKPVSLNSEGFMVVSYYDIAERKIKELREELFFEGKMKDE